MMTKLLKAFGLLVVTAAVTSMAPAQAQTTVRYLHTDALGTVVAKTDANRNVVERTTFEPYGAVVGGAVADGPGYTGHVSDVATGLSYMQQRYYDPEVGLFLSVDPVTAYDMPSTNFNRYVYARNNPYKFSDPDGRLWWTIPTFIGMMTYADNANAPGPNDTPSSNPPGEQIAAAIPGGGRAVAGVRAMAKMADKTHTTYTRSKEDGTTYSGRTSGKGSPEQQVANRTSRPDRVAKTQEGYGPASVDKHSQSSDAIRGREQQNIERHGGARSQGGTSGNQINGVSANNPKADSYQRACSKEFGC